jgi:hypothetical protein
MSVSACSSCVPKQLRQQYRHFGLCEHGWNAIGLLRTQKVLDQGQLHAQDLFLQKEKDRQCLVVPADGDLPLGGQHGQKRHSLNRPMSLGWRITPPVWANQLKIEFNSFNIHINIILIIK